MPPPTNDETVLHHIGGELCWRPLERSSDRLDDPVDGSAQRLTHVGASQSHPAQVARAQVAGAYLRLSLFNDGPGGANRELDLLRPFASDEKAVAVFRVANDGLVHLVAADTQRARQWRGLRAM